MRSCLSTLQLRTQTFVIAAVGAALFWWFDFPLPFLFGPMAACLVAAFSGISLKGFGQVSTGARTILGVAVGATLTPALLLQLPQVAASLAIVPLYIALIGLIGVPFFKRVCGYDTATAYYAAMPGGLQDMVIFGQEAGANPRILSLVHATRVLLIVTLAPVLLVSLFGVTLSNPIGAPVSSLPWHELTLMGGAAIVGWKGGERLGLFGASILGPMLVAACFAIIGLIEHRPPKEAILAAQFFLGTALGVQYMGITLREFRKIIAAAVVFVVLVAVLAAGLALAIPHVVPMGQLEAFLAFAPGGQAEMTVLAIVAGADLGVVIAHHLVRIVVVITCAPLAARWIKGAAQ